MSLLNVAFLFPSVPGMEGASSIRSRMTVEAVRGRVQVHELAMVGAPTWVETSSVEPDPAGEGVLRSKGPGLWHFTRKALGLLETIKPQVIHAITNQAAAPALLYKRRYPEARLIFEIHALAYLELRNDLLRRRLTGGLLDYCGARRADYIVSMSSTQRDLLCRWFRVPPEKVHVSWGPVDMELFRYQDPSPSPPFLVGYSGNDDFWQGVETIFEAARLLEDEEDLQFLIMGFPQERYVEQGLTNVTFLGTLPREEIPTQLSRCHLLLSTRIGGRITDSQYPFKLSAYLAIGRPVVGTRVSDQPLVLDKANCGVVVPPGDARALAQAILQVKRMDEGLRRDMGRNARRFAESHLTIDKLADDLVAIYESALA